MRLRSVVGSRGFWVAMFCLLVGWLLLSALLDRRAERDSPRARAEVVREEVRSIQVEAERCMEHLAASNLRFQAQARETRSLEERIRALEALDDRGVPADSYDVYLETVDRFNASIEGWERRGDALTSVQSECRSLLEARNLLADSLRGILVEMGYLPDETLSPLDLPDTTGAEADLPDPTGAGGTGGAERPDTTGAGGDTLPSPPGADTLSPAPGPGGTF